MLLYCSKQFGTNVPLKRRVKVKGMSSRQFTTRLLQVVRVMFPELYEQHIKGRRVQFINENAPLPPANSENYPKKTKKVGRIGKDLRLLWAVASMFDNAFNRDERRDRKVRGVSNACSFINEDALFSFAGLCVTEFWRLVLEGSQCPRSDKHCITLMPDWSIVSVAYEDMPSLTAEDVHSGNVENFFRLIRSQADISRDALYVKACVDDG